MWQKDGDTLRGVASAANCAADADSSAPAHPPPHAAQRLHRVTVCTGGRRSPTADPPIFYAVASHASARPHGCVSCVCTSVRSRPHAPAPLTSRVRAVALHAPVPRNVASRMSALRALAPTLTRQFRIPSPTLRHIARTTFYSRRSSSHRQHRLTCLVSPYFSAIGNRFPYFQQYFIVAIFITFQTVMNLQIFGEILP